MTNEEALNILRCERTEIKDRRGVDFSGVEALDIAIKTLEQQPKVGKWTCTDDMDEYYGKLSRCSVCGSKVLEADRYCPYCGSYNGGEE